MLLPRPRPQTAGSVRDLVGPLSTFWERCIQKSLTHLVSKVCQDGCVFWRIRDVRILVRVGFVVEEKLFTILVTDVALGVRPEG